MSMFKMTKAQKQFAQRENAFLEADRAAVVDKIGNASFSFDGEKLAPSPRTMSGKPQSPAQKQAVRKAARASVAKRRAQSFARRSPFGG
jgi:hypothetical protein